MEFAQTVVAVLVGAALTFISSALLDRRRERAERARARRQEVLDLRVAARLLRSELLDAMAIMESTLDSGTWAPFPAPTDQWRVHSAGVSRGLAFQEWATVTIAYGRVLEFNQDIEIHRDAELIDHQRDSIEDNLEEIEHAERLLLAAASDAEEVAAAVARYAADAVTERSRTHAINP